MPELTRRNVVGIVAGLAILVCVVWASRGFFRSSPLPSSICFACVSTGEVFWIAREDIGKIPATNPNTGKATLLPCLKENGVVQIGDRYRTLLDKFKEENRYVDPQTLVVRAEPR